MKKLLGIAFLVLFGACGDGNDEQPRALITNEFASDRALVTARYADATFDGPVLPGDVTPKKRVRSGLRLSYALAAEGWNGEGDPPLAQVVRSRGGTDATAQRTVTIVFDERNTFDKCSGMDQEEYDLINTTFFTKRYAVAAYQDIVCP
ncbi:MAG: hypothetical protein H7Z43_03495 [Clostridia bacterium]|nr:hypothetical protein [Deltaproteobacteria bacterium]